MPTQVEQLEGALMAAIGRALDSGSLKGAAPESIKLERPKDRYARRLCIFYCTAAGKACRDESP
jgi:hypothetical protein